MERDANSFSVVKPLLQVDLNSSILVPPYLHLRRVPMAISPDHKSFALGNTNGIVELWNLESHTSVQINAHSKAVRELTFSPEGGELVSVGQDKEVHVWKLSTLERQASATLEEIPDASWSVCVRFSPREDVLAVGAAGQLSIFQRNDLRRLRTIGNQTLFVSLRYSPDGRYLAASQYGPTIKIWDTGDWDKEPVLLRGHQMIPYDIAFSPDRRRMVTGSDRLVIWDTDTWQQLTRYDVPIMAVNRIMFSPDGNELITTDAEAFRIWRATPVEEIAKRETEFGRWR